MLFNKRKQLLFLSILLLFIASLVGGGLVAQDMSTIVFALGGSAPTFDPLAAADSRVDTPSMNLYNRAITVSAWRN